MLQGRPRSGTSRCSRSAAGCRRSTSPPAARCTSTCRSSRTSSTAPTQPPYETAHDVHVASQSPLHRLTGRRRLQVNSIHHQAIDELGENLEIIARAPDGIVEAISDPTRRFCLGVQWHAELLTHRPEHAPVVEALIKAAGRPALKIAA